MKNRLPWRARRHWRRRSRRARSIPIFGMTTIVAMILAVPLSDLALALRGEGDCRIYNIVDGDTVRADCKRGGRGPIRLMGFDTPELKGRCLSERANALAASLYLRYAIWRSNTVELRLAAAGPAQDRYGRRLGILLLDGENVSNALIKRGWAREYYGGRRGDWCGVQS